VLVLLAPTITVMVCWAEIATTGIRAATTVEKRIFKGSEWDRDVVRLVYLKVHKELISRPARKRKILTMINGTMEWGISTSHGYLTL